MVRSPLQKRLASALLLVTIAVQLNASGAWSALQSIPVFTPFIGVQQADAQSNGNFYVENAMPKYGKTWIVVITCRNAAGQNVTYNQGGNAHTLAALVRTGIVAKGLNLTQPQQSIVRSDGGTGAGFNWNENSGTIHMPTVTAVCQILGNMSDTYVSSTCRDDERSGIYPGGKCNFHSPEDNNMHRFTGTLASAACQDGVDNDGDGRIDFPADPGCSSATDTTENGEAACQDNVDNDGDGLKDFPLDPGCVNAQDTDEFNALTNSSNCVGTIAAPDTVLAGQQFQATITTQNNGSTTWTQAAGYKLASENPLDNTRWGLNRVNMTQSSVPPTGSATFTATFTAPQTTGAQSFDWGMVQESVSHFGTICRKTITVNTAQCSATRITANFEGRQGPWEDVAPSGDATPPTFVSNVQAGGTVKVISTSGTYSARIYAGQDQLPLTCDNGTLSFTNNSNQTLSKVKLNTISAQNGVSVPNGATRAYLSHDEPGSYNYFDNSGNRDRRSPCVVTLDVTPNSCQQAQCADGVDNDGDGLVDFPQDPGCVNAQDNDESPRNVGSLDVEKVLNGTLVPGQNATYTITVRNTGNVMAQNVNVYDYFLDSQDLKYVPFTFVSSSGVSCSYQSGAQQVSCPVGTVSPNQTVTMTLTFAVPSNQACTTQIRNRVDAWINGQQAGADVDDVSSNVQCIPQCRNGIDDDGDGRVDFPNDPGCTNQDDNTEGGDPACSDRVDNDSDGLVDFPADPGCVSPTDTDEYNQSLQCPNYAYATRIVSSTEDYDPSLPDGAPDFEQNLLGAPGGSTLTAADIVDFDNSGSTPGFVVVGFNPDTKIVNLPGTDFTVYVGDFLIGEPIEAYTVYASNDGVNFVNLGSRTPATTNTRWQREAHHFDLGTLPEARFVKIQNNNVRQGDQREGVDIDAIEIRNIGCIGNEQCRNGIDDDGDGRIDFPADPACTSPDDNTEGGDPACNDRVDNDGDGLVDFPQDPGCVNLTDTDESNAVNVDLVLQKTGPASVVRGQSLSYTLTVQNASQVQATNVVVTDQIPAGLTYNDLLSYSSCAQQGSNVVCNLGTINANQSGTFTITFDTPAIANCTNSVNVVNNASISSTQTDSNQSNNTASTQLNPTRIDCPVVTPQCRDGIDNDGDGRVDFPADPGCSNQDDTTEGGDPACADRVDNDGDGLVDFPADPGCVNLTDTDETNVQCTANNLTAFFQGNQGPWDDNPAYGDAKPPSFLGAVVPGTNFKFVSAPGYFSARLHNGNDEIPLPCSYGVISFTNDALQTLSKQMLINFPASGFVAPAGTTKAWLHFDESNPGEYYDNSGNRDSRAACQVTLSVTPVSCTAAKCSNGMDDDGDGLVDFPADPGCVNAQDNDEYNVPTPQCRDGIDNDGDGRVDFPADPGCSNQDDTTEGGDPACADRIDNDGDGLIDFPQDPGCSSLADTDEFNSLSCTDGLLALPGLQSITVYEVTTSPRTAITFTKNDVRLTQDITPATSNSSDFSTVANERYDVVITDANGVPNPNGRYLTIQEYRLGNGTTEADAANNVDAIALTFADGTIRYADAITTYQLGSNPLVADGYIQSALGAPNYQFPNEGTFTRLGNGITSLTVAFNGAFGNQPNCPITPQCRDGIDNDNDGRTDFPNDPGCTNQDDNTEGGDPACSDRVDNDGDGLVDFPLDPGCSSLADTDEFNAPLPQCRDGVDNDGDGRVDTLDPGCSNPDDNNEGDDPACSDRVDNDGDNLIDFPFDPGCASPADTDEFNQVQTVDLSIQKAGPQTAVRGQTIFYSIFVGNSGTTQATGVTVTDAAPVGLVYNDSLSYGPCTAVAGQISCPLGTLGANQFGSFTIAFDAPVIANCTSSVTVVNSASISGTQTDSNSTNNTSSTLASPTRLDCPVPTPQCRDGIDNDNDGKVDMLDPGCSNPDDNNEGDEAACQDGRDNDNDGLVDFPLDPGCSSPADTDEFNAPLPACRDGVDNDNDGRVDMLDPGCSNPDDTNEGDDPACSDRRDNDNDGLTDFPQDPGCASPADTDEFNAPNTQCRDGIDNDGDGRVDTNDAGCANPDDNNEGDGAADLGIALTGPATVQGGSTAAYVATVSNNGPDAATSPFSIRISIPTGVSFNAAQSSQGCTQQGTAVVCSNITLGLFQQTTRSIVFNVPGNGQQAAASFNLLKIALGVETAHAQVVGGVCNTTIVVVGTIQGVQPDPNQSNNQSQVSTFVSCQALAQCQDGIDNDQDGKVDFPADPGCSSQADTDETDVAQFGCVEIKKETFDPHGNPLPIAAQFTFILDATRVAYNDASGRARFDNLTAGTHSVAEIIPSGWTQLSVSPQNGMVTVTPGTTCAQVTFRNRQVFVANAQCADGYDNDGDGATDYPQDQGCSSATDNDEYNSTFVPQCSDNVDNDGDGLKDFPLDTGCENAADNNEQNAGVPIVYACSDNVDNDGDGLKDYPLDPGCSSAQDTDETNVVAGTFACNDGIDNDNDGVKDFPQDTGCSSATDTDEFNFRAARCSDGIDNDGDGLKDFPQDTGCTTAYDDNEYNDRLWLDRWREFWNWNW